MSRTLRRLTPSPAMIVALVALVVALSSSGYASQIVPTLTGGNIINNSVTGKDIRDLTRKDIRKRSLRGRKFQLNSVGGKAIKESGLETVPSAGGLDLWAVVEGNGVVARGRDGDADDMPSVEHTPGSDTYDIVFKRDVDGCSYQATIASPIKGQIIVSAKEFEPRKVRVRTANDTGAWAEMPFHVAVIC